MIIQNYPNVGFDLDKLNRVHIEKITLNYPKLGLDSG